MRTASEFRRVYQRGRRARGRLMVVVGLRRRSGSHRLGLSVSKANGNAVRRNRIKRMMREAFRLERHRLPGSFDLVLIPRGGDGKYLLPELREELRELVARLLEDRTGPGKGAGRSRSRRSPGP